MNLLMTLSHSYLRVTTNTTTINDPATYEFFLSTAFLSDTSLQGFIKITFPSNLYTLSLSSYSCYDKVSGNNYTCTRNTTNTLTLAYPDSFSRPAAPFTLVVVDINNPPYTDSVSIQVQYLQTDLSVYSTQSKIYNSLTSTDVLNSCTLTYNPNTVSTNGNLQVSIITNNPIPVGGSINLEFSSTASYEPVYSTSHTITTTTPTFINTAISTTTLTASQLISLPSVIQSTVSALETLTFQVSDLLSPPTNSSTTYTVKITTLASSNSALKIDLSTCFITDLIPLSIATLSPQLASPSLFMVGATTSMPLLFTTPTSMLNADKVILTIASTDQPYLSITTIGLGDINSSDQYSATNASKSIVMTVELNNDIASGTFLLFQNGINVGSLLKSGTFSVGVAFYRSDQIYAEGSFELVSYPNYLTAAQLSVGTNAVFTSTSYTFSLTLNNGLNSNAIIKITMPAEVTSSGTCTASITSSTASASMSGSTICSISSSIITLSSFNVLSLISSTTLTIAISTLINPPSTQPSSEFTIQTFYSNTLTTNAVDNSSSITGLFVNASANSIPDSNVAISRNNTANQEPSIYTLEYTVATIFQANSYIYLALPTTLSLSTSFSASYITITNVTSVSASVPTTLTTSNSSNFLKIDFNGLITTNLETFNKIIVTLTSITNPPSFQPFQLSMATYSSSGFIIQQTSSAPTTMLLQNTIQNNLMAASSTTSIRINGMTTAYSFGIQYPTALSIGDLVTVQLETTGDINTQMYYSSGISCLASAVTASCSLDSSNTNLLEVTLPVAVSASTTFSLTITSIILSRSLQKPGNFYFRCFKVSNSINYNISSTTLTTTSNTASGTIQSSSLSISTSGDTYPSQLNQVQKFSLLVTVTNPLNSGDYVVVGIPTQYSFVGSTVTINDINDLNSQLSQSLCTNVNYFCSNYNGLSNFIQLNQINTNANIFNNISTITIPIKNSTYASPASWTFGNQIFTITTYTNTNNKIDQTGSTTINATFYLTCTDTTNHCSTCDNAGLCLSCYSTGQGYDASFNYDGYFYLTDTGVCVTSCTNGFYNQSNSCKGCVAPCSTCSSSTTCITCDLNSTYNKYDSLNFLCLQQCPTSYFSDTSNICQQCDTNCNTCTGVSSNCTGCTNNTYLSTVNSTCVSSSQCLDTQYADTNTNLCTTCDVSCSGCSNSSTSCSACATGYTVDVAVNSVLPGVCTDQCPDGTVNDTVGGGGCTCSASCLTCSGTLTNCTSCNSTLFFNNTCISTCSNTYYSNTTHCLQCPDTSCKTCDATQCLSCTISTYHLYQGLCLQTCPNSTTSIIENGAFTCIVCVTGCSSCPGGVLTCSSCSTNYMLQANNTNSYCTTSCGTGYVNFNNTNCYTSCPTGYTNESNICTETTTTTTNTTLSTSLTSTSGKIIPFPMIITAAVLSTVVIASKLALPYTIIPAGLVAFLGVLEVLSWIILVFAILSTSSDNDGQFISLGLYLTLGAILINFFLNILALCFFKKYIIPDQKFNNHFKKLQNKTKAGKCMTYFTLSISLIISHKYLQLLFSNLFSSDYFKYKLSQANKMTPLTIVKYISLFPSLLAIVGGAFASYQSQVQGINSFVYIQSIDAIVVTLMAAIAAIWVTVRKPEDYENQTQEKIDEMDSNNFDGTQSNDMNQIIEEHENNVHSKIIHTSSIRKTRKGIEQENPLDNRLLSKKTAIGQQNNHTYDGMNKNEDDKFEKEDLTLPHNDTIERKGRKRINQKEGSSISQIQLDQDSGINLIPVGGKEKTKKEKEMQQNQKNLNKKNSEDLIDSKTVVINPSKKQQNKSFKDKIQNKLTEQQREKTKVIKEVDQVNIIPIMVDVNSQTDLGEKNRQEKLEEIDRTQKDDLEKLDEKDQEKAEEIKDAIDILHAREVKIPDYLRYLDIIQEEQNEEDDEFEEKRVSKGKNSKNKSKSKEKSKPKYTKSHDKKLIKSQTGKNINKIRGQRKSHHKEADDLHVNQFTEVDLVLFQQELAPSIPDVRSVQNNRYSMNNQGIQQKSKVKKNQNSMKDIFNSKVQFDDLQVINIAAHEQQPSIEFEKGNTLNPHHQDEAPFNNINEGLNKEKRSLPINNSKINMQEIEFLESEGGQSETIKGENIHFSMSPSNFNSQNYRINRDQPSQTPTKPKLKKIKDEFQKDRYKEEQLQIQDISDNDDDYDEFQRNYNGKSLSGRPQMHTGKGVNYDQVLRHKKNDNRMKQLEKIYLPRLDVNKSKEKNKKNTYSRHSSRTGNFP